MSHHLRDKARSGHVKALCAWEPDRTLVQAAIGSDVSHDPECVPGSEDPRSIFMIPPVSVTNRTHSKGINC